MKPQLIHRSSSLNLSQILVSSTVTSLTIMGIVVLPIQAKDNKLDLLTTNNCQQNINKEKSNLELEKSKNLSINDFNLKDRDIGSADEESQVTKHSELNEAETKDISRKKPGIICTEKSKQYCKSKIYS